MKEDAMPKPKPKLRFLVLVKYNADAWRKLVSYPEDRWAAVQPVVQNCGGDILRKDLVFQGDHDVVATVEFPDAECAAAFYMAVMAGGAVSDMKVMRLVSIQEGIKVMKKAGAARYSFFPATDPASGAAQAEGSERTGRRRR
jgi:uncharacterized protein with GYD domain